MSLSCIDISHNYQKFKKSDTWHNTKYRFFSSKQTSINYKTMCFTNIFIDAENTKQ
ncbi:hypothetical protein DWX51_07385 [Bacteroides uniformis]|uniref:Uncharacterized protein n=2 Tax=Bacteroidaceae TaxID=815 RepID=Q64QL3_BACFR|nr:hypothetical protein DW230_01810 [Bacteroides sp. AM18-9]RGF00779.1 hypothetical protein DW267_05920 [Bacteroides sp. AM22-3LB]RGL36339.1 hypothetical protein DXC68_03660 [Bacteroides uniformis]RGL88711.1 hypothetical protein DXC44_03165 [Phocaeicola vulgatus]BAD50218.1 hypothetical protein BF3475 [Bacteroides fragilis YCH46]HAN10916.1 hypothetical protein [Bacteroides sp.]